MGRGARSPSRTHVVGPSDAVGTAQVVPARQRLGALVEPQSVGGHLALKPPAHLSNPVRFFGLAHPRRQRDAQHAAHQLGADRLASLLGAGHLDHERFDHGQRPRTGSSSGPRPGRCAASLTVTRRYRPVRWRQWRHCECSHRLAKLLAPAGRSSPARRWAMCWPPPSPRSAMVLPGCCHRAEYGSMVKPQTPADPVGAGDEVAVLPPVSGGWMVDG